MSSGDGLGGPARALPLPLEVDTEGLTGGGADGEVVDASSVVVGGLEDEIDAGVGSEA